MHKNELAENGYVVLKDIFTEGFLENARKLQERIVAYAEKDLEDVFSKYYLRHRPDQGVLYDLYQRHPEFRKMVSNEKILDVLEDVLGPNFYLYENSLIYKPKGKENGVPWHQDFISRPDEPVKYVVWMPLDDVSRENGTLQVIPGSHKQGFLSWHRVKGETHHDRVDTEYIEKNKDKIKYVEMNAGDVLVFNMLVLHGSDEVHTDRPRRVFRCSYQSMDEAVSTPRGAPMVMRGGTPEYLTVKHSHKFEGGSKKPLLIRMLNKIGRILADFG